MVRFRFCAVLATLGFASAASASSIVVDGRYDAAEGYTHHATITPAVAGVGDATAHFYQDPVTKDLYAAVLMPLDYTDTTYGASQNACTHTHHTWWHTPTGSCGMNPKKSNSDTAHTFKDLEKSDHASFDITLGPNSATFGIDLLYAGGSGPSGFTSGPGGADGGGDPGGVLLAGRTSLDYNVNTFTPAGVDAGNAFFGDGVGVSPQLLDPTNLSSYQTAFDYSTQAGDGWIFENVYEFRIDGSSAVIAGNDVLGPNGFTNGFSMTFNDLHASPPKKAMGAFVDTEPTFVPVPEPSPGVLVALGCAALAAARRRR